MAQRDIVSQHDNRRLLDLVAAYCAACAEIARLSDRYADVERNRPYDEEELEAAKTEFDEAWHNIEQIAHDVAACAAHTLKGAQAKALVKLAYWRDQMAHSAIARALCDDLVRLLARRSEANQSPRGFV